MTKWHKYSTIVLEAELKRATRRKVAYNLILAIWIMLMAYAIWWMLAH